MREEMRQRMKANKLKLPPGKADAPSHLAARYNQGQKPIEHPVERDPYGWEWVEDYTPDVLFPGPDLHLAEDAPYELRHPIKRRDFNTDDYDVNQPQAVLSDQQEVLEHALGLLKKPVARKDYWRHSVVLVHPDHTNKPYLHLWGQLLIQTMGFREIGFLAVSTQQTDDTSMWRFSHGLTPLSPLRRNLYARRWALACQALVSLTLAQPERRWRASTMDYC